MPESFYLHKNVYSRLSCSLLLLYMSIQGVFCWFQGKVFVSEPGVVALHFFVHTHKVTTYDTSASALRDKFMKLQLFHNFYL
jgi:hypothetical protein